MKEIGKLWKTWDYAAETLYPLDKPIYQDSVAGFKIGRVLLQYKKEPSHERRIPFVEIRSSLFILERIACSVKHNEPVLLVGETGTGKTTLVQNLALRLGQKLTVLNMSQQSVEEHLGNLARAVLIKRPTSSGKTSLVHYLASVTGHEFVRINNHEHTDLQEYLGSYVTDASGKLVFNEGVLVKAVRNGYWIVLDELNLAPSDVLEALNRLLDDNRELFVPEVQETIKAHPNFMLFGTQNPPTHYGGRKMLSRAFRNRFIEIQVGEDLQHIVKVRYPNQF